MWFLAGLFILMGLYLCWQASRALESARSPQAAASDERPLPFVSVIKPVKGLSAATERCFRSWVESRYPGGFEIIFSFQDHEDPALEIARRLSRDPQVKTLVHPILDGYSGKSSNLEHGLREAKGECLIFSDADTIARPETLAEIVARLEGQRALVSCLPTHIGAADFWGRMYATIWNNVLIGLWAPSMLAGRPPGVAGGTVGFWRRDLEAIGGVKSFANFVAEDVQMGKLFKEAGCSLKLGPIVECEMGRPKPMTVWNALIRAGFATQQEGLRHAMVLNLVAYWYVPAFIIAVLAHSSATAPLIALVFAKAFFYSYFNYLAHGRKNFRLETEAPLYDLLALVAFIRSLLIPELTWSEVSYRVERGGRLHRISKCH